MRKLTIVLMFLGFMVMVVAQLSDVPINHWAYESVKRLVSLKILSGYPDGTFRGNENLTRYQAAVALDRLMKYLEAKLPAAVDLSGVNSKINALSSDQKDLRKRVETIEAVLEGIVTTLKDVNDSDKELREELANIKNDLKALKDQVFGGIAYGEVDKRIAEKVTPMIQKLDSNLSRLETQLQNSVSQLQATHDKDIAALSARLADLESKTDNMYTTLNKNVEETAKAVAGVEELKKNVVTLQGSVTEFEMKLRSIEAGGVSANVADQLKKLSAGVAKLESVQNTLLDKIQGFEKQLNDINGKFSDLEIKDMELETRIAAIEATPFASQIDVVKKMIVDVSARLDALEGKQQNIESNLADVAMLKSELNTLRSILQVDEGKMANMEVTLRNHSSKISEMGSKVEELDVTQKKLSSRVSELQNLLATSVSAQDTLVKQLEETRNEVNSVKEMVTSKPWMEDISSSATEVTEKLTGKVNMAMLVGFLGIVVGAVALVLSFK